MFEGHNVSEDHQSSIMSLLSELEELQRCLEDTTDSESEKLPESAQPPSGDTCNDTNELDSLLQSEFVSLTGLPGK